jgi:hypothetical protein
MDNRGRYGCPDPFPTDTATFISNCNHWPCVPSFKEEGIFSYDAFTYKCNSIGGTVSQNPLSDKANDLVCSKPVTQKNGILGCSFWNDKIQNCVRT